MADAPNPLLQPWATPYELPPFATLRPEHFAPALHEAMRQHRSELDAIAAQSAPATFENTLARLDASGRLLARLESAFHNLCASETSAALQQVQREMAVPLAAHSSAVYMHAGLFARVDALHERRATLGLTPEPLRLLEQTHRDFVRAGARLTPAAQRRYAELMERLATLTTQFGQNVLADENAFRLSLASEADLAGLPDFVRASAQQAAADRGLSGCM